MKLKSKYCHVSVNRVIMEKEVATVFGEKNFSFLSKDRVAGFLVVTFNDDSTYKLIFFLYKDNEIILHS